MGNQPIKLKCNLFRYLMHLLFPAQNNYGKRASGLSDHVWTIKELIERAAEA
jgi:hypothetical protein